MKQGRRKAEGGRQRGENRRPTLQTPRASHQSDSAHWSLLPLALSSPDTIPPLRLPKPELLPGFWEQHGIQASLLGLAVLATLYLLWRALSRKVAPATPNPATTARAALRALRLVPEDAALLGSVSGVLRSYFIAALQLPQAQLTNSELCRALASHPGVEPELSHAAAELLIAMEHQRFGEPRAASDPPRAEPQPKLTVLESALDLIDRTEQALQSSPPAPATA